MTPFLELILVLAILISAAKLAGALSVRLRQPAVLGELLAGVVLGPSVLNLLGWPMLHDAHLEEQVFHFAELGVILLMFVAGLEIEAGELLASFRIATLAGMMGVVVPFAMGAALAWWWPNGYSLSKSLFVGVLLTATSVSISAQTLLELGRLRTRVGLALLGAAVVDDVLVILILSLFVALAAGTGGIGGVLLIVARMALYLGTALLIGRRLVPAIMRWGSRLHVSQPVISTTLVLILLLAWSAEVLGGVAAITGAFLAGLLLGQTTFKHEIETSLTSMTYGFFVPLFFTSIGLQTNLWALQGSLLGFGLAIVVIAIVSKIVGCSLGARLAGMPGPQAFQVGIGMISRGEVGLIVASVGIGAGIISEDLFAVAVLMVLVTTLITPPLLRWVMRNDEPPQLEAPPEVEIVPASRIAVD
jgi:Kef-type K+ transport system membrane component KefB